MCIVNVNAGFIDEGGLVTVRYERGEVSQKPSLSSESWLSSGFTSPMISKNLSRKLPESFITFDQSPKSREALNGETNVFLVKVVEKKIEIKFITRPVRVVLTFPKRETPHRALLHG